MTAMTFEMGDEVIHPQYGFGIVVGVQVHEHEGAPVEYYEIRLAERGGQLSIPVAHAAALGLRRLINGVAATVALLHDTAGPLPSDPRQRSMELAARWKAPGSNALAGGVRDLLAYARRFGLKGSDQQWLRRACERLGTEAARVDGIEPATARNAITHETDELKAPTEIPGPSPAAPAPRGSRRGR